MPAAKPGFVPPQLATLVATAPAGVDWLHEMKFDGYRLQLVVEGSGRKRRAQAFTRRGLDWSEKFPAIVAAAAKLPARSAVIDGEAVVQDAKGRSDFSALQAALGDAKAGLARNRATSSLFDTERFARHIEAAYTAMWQRHQRGEAPAAFAVSAL
jgi:ATP-dependent DNA ligase